MTETIFYGGDIITMEDTACEAVLVRSGRIAAAGSLMDAEALAPKAERIDLQGKTLLPSFLDPHSHILSFASSLGFVSLADARSFDEIAAAVRRFCEASHKKPGQWVVGFGYDHNSLREKIHPTRELLDRAAPENPVLIANASGHMGAANTAALHELGITRDTPDPEGGRIGRDGQGKPTGYLEENAFISMTSRVPEPDLGQLAEQFERAQDIYLSYGITTAQEGRVQPGQMKMLDWLAENGRLKLDVVCYVDENEHAGLFEEYGKYAVNYRDRLKLGGYKILLDGSPQGKTAWMTEPYEGEREYRGYPVHPDERVRGLVQKAVEEKRQLLAHCNGNAAAAQYIAACEAYGDDKAVQAVRPVMIHAQTVRPDQLERMKPLGMIPSFFAAHLYHWGDTHRKNLGARAENISPLRSAASCGIPFTLHQDTPVLPPDMLQTVWCAVNRRTKEGVLLGGGERVSAEEALRGVTANAAYQYFEEKEKGTIREGKKANLVLLDRNPLKVPPEEIKEIAVLATIREGEVLYRRSK